MYTNISIIKYKYIMEPNTNETSFNAGQILSMEIKGNLGPVEFFYIDGTSVECPCEVIGSSVTIFDPNNQTKILATYTYDKNIIELNIPGQEGAIPLNTTSQINEFVNLSNIQIETGQITSNSITINQAGQEYTFGIADGQIMSGNKSIGSYENGVLTFNGQNPNILVDNNGNFISSEDLQIKSYEYTYANNDGSIVITDMDGNKYTLDLDPIQNSNNLQIKIGETNLGTLNPENGQIVWGSGETTQTFDFIKSTSTTTNEFLNLDVLKSSTVQSGSFDLNNNEITVLVDGKSYILELGDPNVLNTCNLLYNNQSIGTFNIESGKFQFTNGKEQQFLISENNEFIAQSDLTIDSMSYTLDGDTGSINVVCDGKEFSFDLSKNTNGTYDIKYGDLLLGKFNEATKEITLEGQTNPIEFHEYQDGIYLNFKELEVNGAVLDSENGTITIISDNGQEYVFNVLKNGENSYAIQDINNNILGTCDLTTGEIDFTPSGAEKAMNFAVTKDNKFVDVEDLEIVSGSLNSVNNTNTITLIDKNGESYTFDIDGEGQILSGDNVIGNFNKSTGVLELGTGDKPITNDFILSKNNTFIQPEDLDIASADIDGNKITLRDNDGEVYEATLDGNNIKYGDKVIGTYNADENQIKINLDDNKTNTFNFIEDTQGKLINVNSLQAESIAIQSGNDTTPDSLTITSANGQNYKFNIYENQEGLYSIVDNDGNLIGTFNENTGNVNFAQSSGPSIDFAKTNDGKFINLDSLDIQSGSYDIKNNTITLNNEDGTKYLFDITKNQDGSFSIKDDNNNVIGGFDPATGELTLGENNEYNFLFSNKQDFIKPEDLKNITSAQYELGSDGKSGTITIFDGDKQYNLDLVINEDGKFSVVNGDTTIGEFDPEKNSITINNETATDKTFSFTEAENNKLVNLKQLDVDSAYINVNDGNNTITLVGKDGNEYEFSLTDSDGNGIYEIKDANGNDIGTFNPKTSELTIGKGTSAEVYDDFIMTNDGKLVNPDNMDITNGSYDTTAQTVTFTDSKGNDYTFDLGKMNDNNICNIMSNGESVGRINMITGDFSFNDCNKEFGDFILSNDNKFLKSTELDPKSIKIEPATAENETDKITITNSDGTEYEFDATINKNNESLYDIKDASGNTIGRFNSETGEFYKGISQSNPVQFAKSNDGTFVDPTKLDVENINYDLEAGTVNIIDKDGTSVEFKIEDVKGDGNYVIKDANNNTIGSLTPDDMESSITIGGKTFKVETLSEENKNIFNTIFENNKELSDYLKKGDYDGLKEALNKELEETLGEENPELLEKTQKVINDMDLDGVKTKEEFLGALNKSLDDNGFDGVEDIKIFPSLEEILTHPAAIAGYSVAGIILMALIRMLIKQLLQKQEEKEEEKNKDFNVNAKSNKGNDSYENVYNSKEDNNVEAQAEKGASVKNKNGKQTISAPGDLDNIESKEQGKSK